MDQAIDMDILAERDDDNKLDKYRNKGDAEKSAVASHAVRQHLANFILSKRPSQEKNDKYRSSSGNIIADVQQEDDEPFYEPRSKSSFTTGLNSTHQNCSSSYRDDGMECRDEDATSSSNNRRYNSQMKTSTGKKTNDHYVKLRKTASLPTMLLSLKSQTASRRRHFDRRTTMSPIMKRKVKHRRPNLEQASSSSTEYTSNPSIDQAIRAATNASNSARSPTPPLLQNLTLDSSNNLNGSAALMKTSNSIFSGAVSSQTNLANSSCDFFNPLDKQTQKHRATNYDNNQSSNNNYEKAARTNMSSEAEKISHQRVNQALRMAVIQRATSKGKLFGNISSTSLDISPHIDQTLHQTEAGDIGVGSRYNLKQSTANSFSRAPLSGDCNKNNNDNSINDNDFNNKKINDNINNQFICKQHSSPEDGVLFGIQARRNLASSLSFSNDTKAQVYPNVGQSSKQSAVANVMLDNAKKDFALNQSFSTIAGNSVQQHLYRQDGCNSSSSNHFQPFKTSPNPMGASPTDGTPITLLANRLSNRFSCSSSSISTLISQLNETPMDTGSQPIDLSSSTESHRSAMNNVDSNQPQAQHIATPFTQSMIEHQALDADGAESKMNPLTGNLDCAYQHYQSILQKSFNQLQLRQSHENMALLQQACLQHEQAGDPLSNKRSILKTVQFNASRDVSSLDNPKCVKGDNNSLISSPSSGSLSGRQCSSRSSHSERLLFKQGSEQLSAGVQPQGQLSRDELTHLLAQYHHRHEPSVASSSSSGAVYGEQSHSDRALQPFELFNRWLSVYGSYIREQQQHQQICSQQRPSASTSNWSRNSQIQDLGDSSAINLSLDHTRANAQPSTDNSKHFDQELLRLRNMLKQEHHQRAHGSSSLIPTEPNPFFCGNKISNVPSQIYKQRLNSTMARTLSSPLLVSTGPVSSTAGRPVGLTSTSRQANNFNVFQFDSQMPTTTSSSMAVSNIGNENSIMDMQVDDDNSNQIHELDEPYRAKSALGGTLPHSPRSQNNTAHLDGESTISGQAHAQLVRFQSSSQNEYKTIIDNNSNQSSTVPMTISDYNFSHSTGIQAGARGQGARSAPFCTLTELDALRDRVLNYEPEFNPSSSTGITFDRRLCDHRCICGKDEKHPENSFRVLAIWSRLHERGLIQRCARVSSREATFDEIKLIHGHTYACYFGLKPLERTRIADLDLSKLNIPGLVQLECGGQGVDVDTFWNEEKTPGALRLAVGSVIEAVSSVARGQLLNSFAIVRPPGLHAEADQTNGFCFFNSLAISARVLTNRFHLKRILIVDWDVHHGNGIQKAFYEDQKVVYVSLHRHDRGTFFPGTGPLEEFGEGYGMGYNWNIAWSDDTMGDAEYLAAFRSIVMPIARDFDPSMVLVACGFDAASGHPQNFGGYNISPACFAVMTRQLMTLANGRIVLCLEGGFQLNVICECAEACLRTLLNDQDAPKLEQIDEKELKRRPCHSAQMTMRTLGSIASKFWPSVERWSDTIEMSVLEAANYNH